MAFNMDDIPSPTDISSSLAEFVRKEKLLKDLYQDSDVCSKSSNAKTSSNDEEIDNILQQMGRILSPTGQEFDNRVYKHVMAETKNKSIEQIITEAKELVSENSQITDNASSSFSTDDLLSSFDSENDVTLINVGNGIVNSKSAKYFTKTQKKQQLIKVKDKDQITTSNPKKDSTSKHSLQDCKGKISNEQKPDKNYTQRNDMLLEEIQILREEVQKVNGICESYKTECSNLRSEIYHLEQQWLKREKQLMDENHSLKQNITSSISQKDLESFQLKLNSANETIAQLKHNLKQINEDWRKKEMKLNHECDLLRHQLKSAPKFAQPDFEKLQEQLKDSKELNVKLELDFENCKDKCNMLENLCNDFKKVIMDEQLAEKVYTNNNVPVSVKQYLSSSPSTSVINTLSNMFGCLSRSNVRSRNLYCGQKEKNDMFTTNESSLINDLGKTTEPGSFIRELLNDKEKMRKENQDLHRQVKELESIVRRRVHPNFSNVSEIIKNDHTRTNEKENEVIKVLQKGLLEKEHIIIELKNKIVESKALHDQNLLSLQSKIVNIQEDSIKMKEELEKKKVPLNSHVVKCRRKGRSCDPPQSNVRSVRTELSAKEREVQLLNKQLDELKKTNRRLLRDKENYYLSSKEQSLEEIQLNKKLSPLHRVNERANQHGCDHSSPKRKIESTDNDLSVSNSSKEEQMLENANYEQWGNDLPPIDRRHNGMNTESKELDDSGSPISNQDIPDPNTYTNESNPQNLQKIIRDLFTLLTKEEIGEKIQHSDGKCFIKEQEQLLQFVSVLKNYAN